MLNILYTNGSLVPGDMTQDAGIHVYISYADNYKYY